MPRSLALTAAVFAAALVVAAPAVAQTPSAITTHAGSNIYGLSVGGDYAVLDVGSQAPDFSFESASGSMRLRDLRAQGHVLLLVCPADDQLLSLERERTHLLAMGVVPVAVLDRRGSACSSLANKLHLGYSLVSDTRRVIGAQFNALDPSSRTDAPAWFVIDRTGRVRGLAHGAWPNGPWTELCAGALGLPASDAPLPASYRH